MNVTICVSTFETVAWSSPLWQVITICRTLISPVLSAWNRTVSHVKIQLSTSTADVVYYNTFVQQNIVAKYIAKRIWTQLQIEFIGY